MAKAEARIMGETSAITFASFQFHPQDSDHSLFLIFLDLSAQLESLRLAVEYAAGFVNARGAAPVVRLHDILNRVREVALHGVRHGAAMALASAQAHSGHELWFLPHGFLAMAHPGVL